MRDVGLNGAAGELVGKQLRALGGCKDNPGPQVTWQDTVIGQLTPGATEALTYLQACLGPQPSTILPTVDGSWRTPDPRGLG